MIRFCLWLIALPFKIVFKLFEFLFNLCIDGFDSAVESLFFGSDGDSAGNGGRSEKKPFKDCDGDCLTCGHFEVDCDDYDQMEVWEDLLDEDD